MPREETIQARRHRVSLIPRACEACKTRKIRCNRSNPCSNCQTSGISCQQVNASSRQSRQSSPKTGRIDDLADHVDRLEARLSMVEGLLQRPPGTQCSTPLQSQSASPPVRSGKEPRISTLTRAETLYEGSSSFTSASVEASAVAKKTATSDTPDTSWKVNESLTHLNILLHPNHTLPAIEDHRLSSSTVPRPNLDIDLLPLNFITVILQKVKSQGSVLLLSYCVNDVSLIESLCKSVYFPMKPASIDQVTALHGILYILIEEYEKFKDPLAMQYDLQSYSAQCQRIFNTGIETYDILAVPSFESVLALTLAVTEAQNAAKPLLACTFLSVAASHCQTLGYHRESTYQNDKSGNGEHKRRIFWTLYIIDRNLSILLGRGSRIPDIDVDARYPEPSSDPGRRPWDEWHNLAINLAKIQGEIYNRLYSASAQATSVADRSVEMDRLKATMQQLRGVEEQLDTSKAYFPRLFDMATIQWDITYYSTLTSLLRSLSTSATGAEISAECFQAARLSLESHLHLFAKYSTSEIVNELDYAGWVLHNSSFTPFLVIFLHAIASTSLHDMALLDKVVETLHSTRKASKSSERLYQICATFAQLARRMVETKNSCAGIYNKQADTLEIGNMTTSFGEQFQRPPDLDKTAEEFTAWLDSDASSILSGWMNGQQSASDFLSMDISKEN